MAFNLEGEAMHYHCNRCQGSLTGLVEAYICQFECVFCADCALLLDAKCPNCSGALKRRLLPEEAGMSLPVEETLGT